MNNVMHAAAVEHIPRYVVAADGSDPLFTKVIILTVVTVVAVGVLYLRLHSLPEKLAHRQNHGQLQLVTVLTLLALFTHNNLFWVLAILLVMIQPPDFLTPLKSIAHSLQRYTEKSEVEPPADARIEEDK